MEGPVDDEPFVAILSSITTGGDSGIVFDVVTISTIGDGDVEGLERIFSAVEQLNQWMQHVDLDISGQST